MSRKNEDSKITLSIVAVIVVSVIIVGAISFSLFYYFIMEEPYYKISVTTSPSNQSVIFTFSFRHRFNLNEYGDGWTYLWIEDESGKKIWETGELLINSSTPYSTQIFWNEMNPEPTSQQILTVWLSFNCNGRHSYGSDTFSRP
ncbi:MAG: hypothetical protein HZB92_09140 [Euryarchaeota archaeon]|nr:hypothetical protein [Euryarchaeota archaeon]